MSFGLNDVRDLINLYVEVLRERYHDRLVSVALFGSIVRGEAVRESDIDILVVVEGLPPDVGARFRELTEPKFGLRKTRVYQKLYREGKPTSISEVILTPEEVAKHPPILLDIVVDGIILYQRDGFLEEELERIKKRLSELGSRRVRGKHGWYWVLKPDAKFGEAIEI